MITIHEMLLPVYWSTYLVNGEATHLDEHEFRQVRKFEEFLTENHMFCVDVKDDQQFMTYHDAREFGVMPCDVATFVFHRQEKK